MTSQLSTVTPPTDGSSHTEVSHMQPLFAERSARTRTDAAAVRTGTDRPDAHRWERSASVRSLSRAAESPHRRGRLALDALPSGAHSLPLLVPRSQSLHSRRDEERASSVKPFMSNSRASSSRQASPTRSLNNGRPQLSKVSLPWRVIVKGLRALNLEPDVAGRLEHFERFASQAEQNLAMDLLEERSVANSACRQHAAGQLKPSSKLLNLRKIEDRLARGKAYAEAALIRREVEELMRQEELAHEAEVMRRLATLDGALTQREDAASGLLERGLYEALWQFAFDGDLPLDAMHLACGFPLPQKYVAT